MTKRGLFIFCVIFIVMPFFSFAHSGNTDASGCHTCRTNCTSYGLYYGEYHCHNPKSYSYPSYPTYPTTPTCPSNSSYDSLSDSCKCYSGYIVSGDSCVSGNSYCWDKYGYNSEYDSLEKNCKCNYGYAFGKDSIGRTQCVSLDSMCEDQLGYHSSYNSLHDKCECSYGYIIKGGQCVDGTSWCRSTQGLYSSYSTSAKSCECDDGYTLDDSGQCVKKQNNVYFTLKELDTSNKKAIIKSDYDYKYYLISYNTGCYSTSFSRYLGDKIVVNLGTDFYLDRWDKIVLQNDNETCDITNKESADSSTTLKPEEESTVYYVPAPTTPSPATNIKTPEVKKEAPKPTVKKEAGATKTTDTKIDAMKDNEIKKDNGSSTASSTGNKEDIIKKENVFKRIWKWLWS